MYFYIRKLIQLLNNSFFPSWTKSASFILFLPSTGTELKILIRTSALNKTVFQHFLCILLEFLQKKNNIFFSFLKKSVILFLENLGGKYNPQTQKYILGLPKQLRLSRSYLNISKDMKHNKWWESYPWHCSKKYSQKKSTVEMLVLKSKAIMDIGSGLIQRNEGHITTQRITKMSHIFTNQPVSVATNSFPICMWAHSCLE